jgi:hypothetical protein
MFLHLAVFNSLPPPYLFLIISYACASRSVSSSQAASSPMVRFLSRHHLSLRSLFRHYLSRPAQACPRNLTEGNGRCWKRQQTEDQTCTKLGCRLGAQMETHNSHLHLQWVYYIQQPNKVKQQFSGERAVPAEACSLLGINPLAPFCGWGCAKLKTAVYLIQLCLCTPLSTTNDVHL